jgi:hypothetical protein
MKSDHRHDLKTNELAEWIINFPNWAKENSRTIIYVAVALALVLGAYLYYNYTRNILAPQKQAEFTELFGKLSTSKMKLLQAQSQGKNYSAELIQLADEFQAAAQNTENNQQAALALIERGQLLRMELHYRLKPPGDEEVTTQINLAKTSYNEAMTKAGNNLSLTAMAKLGLGLCEEELGNFDQAVQIYRDITANASFNNTIQSDLAAKRLNALDDYKQKVVFKEPSVQAPNDVTQSPIQLGAVDFNLPN